MNDICKDEMLQELAAFVGINLERDLEVDSIKEMSDLYYAHEITEEKRDEIISFLSQAKLPTQPDMPKFIFKALKFNDTFYLQNLALIRATEPLRKNTYNCKVIDSKLALKKEIDQFMKNVSNSQGSFSSAKINDSCWESFPTSIAASSGDTMSISAYEAELSNVSLKIDFSKSYEQFFKKGVKFRIYADFTEGKDYYLIISDKNKRIYSKIINNEAIIETNTPEDYRSGKVISIYCKEEN